MKQVISFMSQIIILLTELENSENYLFDVEKQPFNHTYI